MTALQALLVATGAAVWLALGTVVGLVAARMYQLEEYEGRRLFSWGATRAWCLHGAVLVGAVPPLAALLAATVSDEVRRSPTLVAASWTCGAALAVLLWRWPPAKKPLVLTPRAWRLLGTALVLGGIVAAGVGALVAVAAPPLAAAAITALLAGTPLLTLALLAAANQAMRPLEASVRSRFLRSARARLDAVQPLVIAVAGSYGKTSTKHILAHLLAPYGEVLPTPKSFNTLMGVTRTINENLQERHRTFIVEMDAYAPGEIAAMCALVHPQHAIVTSVGPQHLERFHSLDRITQALYETVESLPPAGVAVVHAGDAASAALAERASREGHATVTYAAGGGGDVVVENLRVSGVGSSFTWSWPSEGLRHDVTVPLLGRHQALNVAAALALVHRLGNPLGPALEAVGTLQPIEHRLQPVPTATAITVIDDSYNANVVGVHNALEVLTEIDAAHRILVTPGLVELGAVEEAENRKYGEHAARVCDHVIVVEARTGEALRAGLRQGGLDASRVHTVRSLEEASAVIASIAAPGDAVLFANDLPDTYIT
ncbi:MAG: Mur ligase family protein [Candidatus Dormibacteria bacterium]